MHATLKKGGGTGITFKIKCRWRILLIQYICIKGEIFETDGNDLNENAKNKVQSYYSNRKQDHFIVKF